MCAISQMDVKLGVTSAGHLKIIEKNRACPISTKFCICVAVTNMDMLVAPLTEMAGISKFQTTLGLSNWTYLGHSTQSGILHWLLILLLGQIGPPSYLTFRLPPHTHSQCAPINESLSSPNEGCSSPRQCPGPSNVFHFHK